MNTISEILEHAKRRAEQAGLPYAGALTPQEAFEVMQKTEHAKLVDVRSSAELDLVGKVPAATHIEWAFYPGMLKNPDFEAQLNMKWIKRPWLFLCAVPVGARIMQLR